MNCWSSGVTYSITCKPCLKDGRLAEYRGESGRSLYTRGLEHERHLLNGTRGQPLSDHARNRHQGQKMTREDFEMKMTGRYPRALSRILSEGIQIDRLVQTKAARPSQTDVLNSKLNFHQAKPIRLTTTDQAL